MTRRSRPPKAAPHTLPSGTMLHCQCPHCRASLHEGDRVAVDFQRPDRSRGRLLLSPRLNHFESSSTQALPDGEEVALFCPHCGHTLGEPRPCEECGARVARIGIRLEPDVFDFYFCLRKGCFWHGLSDEARDRLLLDITGA